MNPFVGGIITVLVIGLCLILWPAILEPALVSLCPLVPIVSVAQTYYNVPSNPGNQDEISISSAQPNRGAFLIDTASGLVGDPLDSFTVNLKREGTPTGNFNVVIRNSGDVILRNITTTNITTLSNVTYTTIEYTFESLVLQNGDKLSIEFNGGDGDNYLSVETIITGTEPVKAYAYTSGVWAEHTPAGENIVGLLETAGGTGIGPSPNCIEFYNNLGTVMNTIIPIGAISAFLVILIVPRYLNRDW